MSGSFGDTGSFQLTSAKVGGKGKGNGGFCVDGFTGPGPGVVPID